MIGFIVCVFWNRYRGNNGAIALVPVESELPCAQHLTTNAPQLGLAMNESKQGCTLMSDQTKLVVSEEASKDVESMLVCVLGHTAPAAIDRVVGPQMAIQPRHGLVLPSIDGVSGHAYIDQHGAKYEGTVRPLVREFVCAPHEAVVVPVRSIALPRWKT